MQPETAVDVLAALANAHRLAVFRCLVRAGPSGLSAGELAREVGLKATALTFHLRELDHAGLTQSRREGRFIRTRIEVETVRALLAFLTRDCCGGRAELCGDLAAAADRLCC